MGFDFRPRQDKADARRADEGTLERHERHERVQSRILGRDDTEFWIAVCFASEAEMAEFSELVGVDTSKHTSGIEFRELCAGIRPLEARREFVKPRTYRLPKGWALDWIGTCRSYADMLTAITFGTLDEMLKADAEPVPCFYVYFRDRADKLSFLAEWNVAKYGDKYLDGSKWLEAIKRERAAG